MNENNYPFVNNARDPRFLALRSLQTFQLRQLTAYPATVWALKLLDCLDLRREQTRNRHGLVVTPKREWERPQ